MNATKTIYNIDKIEKNRKTNELIISGWAFDEANKTATTISVPEEQVSNFSVTNLYRSDVIMVHKLSAKEEVGFEIRLTPKNVATLPITFGESEIYQLDTKQKFTFTPESESDLTKLLRKTRKGLGYLKRNGLKRTLQRVQLEQTKNTNENYQQWIAENENWQSEAILAEIEKFAYQPKISILVPVYNVEKVWLDKCIESIENQYYSNWELCIADDASTDPEVRRVLDGFANRDDRVKVYYRPENGHISKATNSALAIATGEFVALLDNDDELPAVALYEVVKCLNQNPELDLIYSDEDKIDLEGQRFEPAFKPDWSPDLLLGTNYISHLGVYRKSLMDEIGGFRVGYEGAQDYDLVLRFTEATSSQRIAHIPKVLYHWRVLPTSTAADQSTKGYAFEAGLKAVSEALQRRKISGYATHAAGNGLYDVHYEILKKEKVSIIIPTKNGYEDMKRCLTSIVDKTDYDNYEIIVADNGSTEERMFELYQQFGRELGENFSYQTIDIPFNFSKINNIAAATAKGNYLLFLNNDTEVISPDWLTKMVSFAQLERIGCVGAKLYYPNHTIQHAGVILGLGGAAGHGHHTFPQGDFGYYGKLEINVDYLAITAACLMVKKADFDQVGGFDEELTVAFNDVDLCLKIYELGRNNIWLHGVELFHFESQSRGYENTPEKQARFQKETATMETRWQKYIDNDPYYNPNLSRTSGDFSIRVKA
ncbi:glycosyltransferase involved in cell wall biosynthesis [Enterococcus sp. PF1-24]|uniref:glycosyltransferase family 2 protein n=1 Tax=unclassified Enterococcus TaxID=2608891 RepID=UPI002472F340|nr:MULTISPECIES: glycosyltransferase family 2 protein [unclassified Enterococcus]MDH6364557.1 glycosyltransferase involved in cell wall biosynthesis [Enterococcus sp. PFB1-1]MDH6401658.1 glycosyltransferase involved in cell wall biosynthesis [Enterococcus sp. PF1-24]